MRPRSATFVACASLIILVCAALCVTSCSTIARLRASYAIADCDGALLSTAYIHGGYRLHDRVRYDSDQASVGYDVITEVGSDELTVVVLTAFGNKAMSLRQRGERVEVTNHMGRAAVLAPMNLLRDLHRVHFLPAAPAAGDVLEDRLSIGGFAIYERFDGAHIIREVVGPGDHDRATVTINSGTRTKDTTKDTTKEMTTETVIERDQCGYRARFVTLSSQTHSPITSLPSGCEPLSP